MGALLETLAVRIAPVLLANLTTRYPYCEARLFNVGDPPFDPIAAHPAFGNAYDWHSSAHSHWTALQVLAHFAERNESLPVAAALHGAVASNLCERNVRSETLYLARHPGYERPYGRAWALALAAAAAASPFASVRALSAPLRAMAGEIAAGLQRWLETMPGPVRHGVHSNTAFALGLALDAARSLRLDGFERAAVARALDWFASDRDYPHAWERSAHDFLSPGLAEADLMRRALGAGEFRAWWRRFLDGAGAGAELFAVAAVPEGADGQLVHLHGLNLSRAGALARIAAAAGEADAWIEPALCLYRAGVDAATAGGDYLSTHWLATFAWDAAASLDATHNAC